MQSIGPLHEEIFHRYPTDYYWTCVQSEWATEILFHPGELKRLEPLWLEHGMLSFSSPDMLRFLGCQVPLSDRIPARFSRPLSTDFKLRQEGASYQAPY